MPDLPQCDAFGVIYDQHGDGAPDVLVTLKRVEDASGQPILLSPLTTVTDAAGVYHFTLPQASRAFITARATTLFSCNGGIAHLVPSAPSGPLAPILTPPPEAAGFVVVPPLYYSGNTLSMTQVSRSSDGWLAASDFSRFDDVEGQLGDYVPLAGGVTMTGYLTLYGNPLATYHAATKNYVDMQIAAIPPSGAKPAGSGSELQYRLNANDLGALPSSYGASGLWGMLQTHLNDSLAVDGYLSMRSTAGGTQFFVSEPGVNPCSIFYAINTASTPRYIYFGRGNPFGTPPLTCPQYISFYTGTTGTEDVRRMYLSPVGSLVINVQALANQAAALTVNQNGNTAFSKALQVNGLGEMSADPTTALGIATKQYVDSHSFVLNLAADYPWTGKHSFSQAISSAVDQYGTTSMLLQNRDACVGVVFKNLNLDVFDLNLDTSSAARYQIRAENRAGVAQEFQFSTPAAQNFLRLSGARVLSYVPIQLANNVALQCTYTNGNAANMLRIQNPFNYALVGPETDYNNTTTGTQVYYLCGTGIWSSTSYGAANVNAGYPWPFTWDFMSHMNVRGALRLEGSFTPYAAPALILGQNVPLKISFDASNTTNLIYDDGTYIHIGPEFAAPGNLVHGRYINFQVGTGSGDGAPGSVLAHGPQQTWFFRAAITMSAGYGYQLTLGEQPVLPMHATTKQYVDRLALGNAVLATYSATFATNAALGRYFRIPLTGPLALAAPTGMVDGQTITWEFVQDTAGNHAVTLDPVFVAGDAGPFAPTLTANARSYFVGAYHASTGKWDVLAQSGGYL